MLKKLLSKSGRRILKAIKKLSIKSRKAKKSNLSYWHAAVPDLETASLSLSLPSLDTKSIDTFMTYVENTEDCVSRCCHCDEYEENQKNENRENEMII